MGMLDQILGGLTGQSTGQSGNSMQGGSLMDLATSMIQGQSGGLGGLLSKFQSAGLGEQADSWVSTGANKPVTPDQMSNALGSNNLAGMAQKFGINPQMAGAALATLLPMLIDHLTPKGRVEPNQDLGSDLTTLRSKYMA